MGIMKKEFLNMYALLDAYAPMYTEEVFCKARMLDVLRHCDDCFLRSCRIGHFTASAFLLNKDLTAACLMHHTKLNKWLQLGGHCDGDPDILNVAIKEAQEESGIQNIRPIKPEIFDIDIHLVPDRPEDPAHYHFDIRFLLHAYDDDTLIKNHESHALRWVNKHSSDISENVGRMFKKWHDYVL